MDFYILSSEPSCLGTNHIHNYGIPSWNTSHQIKSKASSTDNTTYSKQFSSRWYLRTWKCSYALHPVSQKFPQNDAFENVHLIDDGTLLYFQGRPSSTSSFHASFLPAINGVMSLALCLHVESQAPQHSQFSKAQVICNGCFIYSKYSIANATESKQSRLFFFSFFCFFTQRQNQTWPDIELRPSHIHNAIYTRRIYLTAYCMH